MKLDQENQVQYWYVDYLENIHQYITFLGVSPQRIRYNLLRAMFREAMLNAVESNRNKRISSEIMQEFHTIESYGFDFAPSLYTEDGMDRIDGLISKLNTKEDE